MKRFGLVLIVLAGFGLMFGACGDDGAANDCEKVAQEQEKAITAVCSGKSDECWSCDCFNQGKMLDTDMTDPLNPVYSCIDIPPCTEYCDPVPCEGTALAAAEVCLADVAACTASDVASMGTLCDLTAKL